MALINCPECGREKVSDTAHSCPDCGFAIQAHFEKIKQEKAMEKLEREMELKEEQTIQAIRLPDPPKLDKDQLLVYFIILISSIFAWIMGLRILPGIVFVSIFIVIVIEYYEFRKKKEAYVEILADPDAYRRKKYNEPNKSFDNNIPTCPTCSSTKVQKIGGIERSTSVGLFGLHSSKIGKSYKCSSCGYKW